MVDFDALWSAYPQEHSPCQKNGVPNFVNQCAIRFGLALIDGGVDTSSFPGVCCWFDHEGRHLLRGEEIAAWMRSKPDLFGDVSIFGSVDASKFTGKRGLIFCRNFWGPGNQGDHIDLWNLTLMMTGNDSYISRSSEVWFWELDSYTRSSVRGAMSGGKRQSRSRSAKVKKN